MALKENYAERAGVVAVYILKCTKCSEYHRFQSSKKKYFGFFEANLGMIYVLHCIGKEASAGTTLRAMINLPIPPTAVSKYRKVLLVI